LIAGNAPGRRHCATRGDRRWLDTVVYALLADEGRALARRRQGSSASYRRQSATLNADELMTLVIGLGGS
jgi:hypothetical protein